MDVLFDVVDFDVDGGVGLSNPVGDALSEVHRTVLSTGAAKRDHQVAEMPFQIVVDALRDKGFHMVEKLVRLWLGFEVLRHLPVAACLGLELGLSSRIGKCSTVEHEAASIAAVIVGVTLFKRETVDGYCEVRG